MTGGQPQHAKGVGYVAMQPTYRVTGGQPQLTIVDTCGGDKPTYRVTGGQPQRSTSVVSNVPPAYLPSDRGPTATGIYWDSFGNAAYLPSDRGPTATSCAITR